LKWAALLNRSPESLALALPKGPTRTRGLTPARKRKIQRDSRGGRKLDIPTPWRLRSDPGDFKK